MLYEKLWNWDEGTTNLLDCIIKLLLYKRLFKDYKYKIMEKNSIDLHPSSS